MSNLGFWAKLKKPALPDGSRGRPIFCLAPMADVTDCAFRQIIAKYGKPDVFFTEFVSADGLCSDGRDKLLIDLKYCENERPIVAQIFGSKPENFEKVARMLSEMNFDGIDINMGCPVKKILNQNACSALIKTPKLAREIILAAKRGAGNVPISVKTRIGFSKVEIETWISAILETNPAALTVHLRTVKEMSKVPAHWDLMKGIVEIRNKMGVETLILGNGDILNLEDAKKKVKETGCDGVMLGRAIFGNPWLFANLACAKHNCQIEHPASDSPVHKSQILSKFKKLLSLATQSRNSAERSACIAFNKKSESGAGISIKEKLRVMVEHTKLFEKMLGKYKNFAIMKKHFKAYVSGFDGAKELRIKLMETENIAQVENIIKKFIEAQLL